MKAITSGFKNTVKMFGRELDSIITYDLEGETIELGSEELNSITPHYEGSLLKSVMKCLELDSNEDIPLETVLSYQFGVKVNGVYEYINFGNYIVYSSEKQEDTGSYKIICYDKMLYSMKDYEDLNLTYPITIRDYIDAICTHLGLTFKNASDTFANYNRQIPNELYLDSDGNSLGYTFRDVLDEIAQATGSTICVNEQDDELEVRYVTETNDTIDEYYLKDINVNFGEKYGPINSIVLSRAEGSDNVYIQDDESIAENGLCEIKIKDNQIMNFNDRSDYLNDLFVKLNGLEYFLNDFASTGITYYDLCDRYSIQIGNETYSCIMLNDEILITQGLEENIHTDLLEVSETDYTKADKTDRKINQTYLIVDKQNQTIESVVSNVTEQNNKISQITQTVDELNSKIQDIADITIAGESSYATFDLDGINQSEPIMIKVYPMVNSISCLYPRSNLYPSNALYMPTRTIRFANLTTEENIDYELPEDLLLYDSEHYDEFYLDYDSQTCQITKRCEYNANGTISLLQTEQIINYPYPQILLTDGDYRISILGYSNGYLFARLMAQNIYTTQFATRAEVHSEISQTADSINLEVSKKVNSNEIISAINLTPETATINANKISLAGKTINLTGDNVSIISNNFNVDTNGNLNCNNANISGTITSTNGTIAGWTLASDGFTDNRGFFINTDTTTWQGTPINYAVSNVYTMSDIIVCQSIILGILPTPESNSAEFKHFDINGDGRIDAGDLIVIRKMLDKTL